MLLHVFFECRRWSLGLRGGRSVRSGRRPIGALRRRVLRACSGFNVIAIFVFMLTVAGLIAIERFFLLKCSSNLRKALEVDLLSNAAQFAPDKIDLNTLDGRESGSI